MRHLKIRAKIIWCLLTDRYTWSERHQLMYTWTRPQYMIDVYPTAGFSRMSKEIDNGSI